MNKIRIGKDLKIQLTVLTNGANVPLEGRDIELHLRNPFGDTDVIAHTVSGNVLSAILSGAEQKYCGVYTLTVWENRNSIDSTVLDFEQAFELVSSTALETPKAESLEVEEVVALSGDMAIGVQGASAYEIAVANGFKGTEAEWLESLKLHYDDLTAEEKAELQKPITDIAVSVTEAERQRQQAEEIRRSSEVSRTGEEEKRVTAEGGRKTAEDARVTAETKRVSAETSRAEAEVSRSAEEKKRASAEVLRAEAEVLRATAESKRGEAEAQRMTDEDLRKVAEQNRVKTERARVTAEAERMEAEAARTSEEGKRVVSEDERSKTEQVRVTAEEGRKSAEQARVTAEANRQQQTAVAIEAANIATETANQAAQTASNAAIKATEATQLANQAASKASTATQTATEAATTAAQTEATIKQAEAERVSAEKQRQISEQNREQAETSRKQAEKARVTAEANRQQQTTAAIEAAKTATASATSATAEAAKAVTAATNATAEAKEATKVATEAAGKANEATASINDRLSQTYPNFDAIKASGETNPNKIYIDGATAQPYIYKDGGYVPFKGSEGEDYTIITYSPFNAFNTSCDRTATSLDYYNFGSNPLLMSFMYIRSLRNNFYGIAPLLSLTNEEGLIIGYYINGYGLRFKYIEDGKQKEITIDTCDAETLNGYLKLCFVIDFNFNRCLIVGYKDNAVNILDSRIVNISGDTFKKSKINARMGLYESNIFQHYIIANNYLNIEENLKKQFSIGSYSKGLTFDSIRDKKDMTVNSLRINKEGDVKANIIQNEGRHLIAEITNTTRYYCNISYNEPNLPNIRVGSIFIKFKILNGDAHIISGAGATPIVLDNLHNKIPLNQQLAIDKEYILIIQQWERELWYCANYGAKFYGTFKIEVLDYQVGFVQSQICSVERIKGDIITGGIPMKLSSIKNIAYPTPMVSLTRQGIIGQIYQEGEDSYITTLSKSGTIIYKKITP